MTKKKFTNRKVDKVPLKKSKDYMWRYIKGKTLDKGKNAVSNENDGTVWDKLRSWLLAPAKLVSAGVVAAALVFVLVFTTNFGGWFDGKDGSPLGSGSIAHANFEMTAVDEAADGVAKDSKFVLAASEDLDTEVLSENLRVSPEVEVKIEKTEAGIFEITPTENLDGNTIYKFSIETEEENFSWAYQVKDEFQVSGSLPANEATSVPTDSGIEIYFSHENWDLSEAEKKFSISPKVDGRFEQHRRALSFIPKNGLEEATVYTVSLKSGLELEDSEQEVLEDYVFQFETTTDSSYTTPSVRFRHQNYEMPSGTALGLRAYTYNLKKEEDQSIELSIYQYKNSTEFRDALMSIAKLPNWCYHSKRLHRHETDSLNKIGTFEALPGEIGYQTYIYVPELELETGFYLVEAEIDGAPQALVQVSDLAAYVKATETDTIVWVHDLESGEFSAATTVEADEAKSVKTDSDGVATFPTPSGWSEHNYSNAEAKIVYIKSADGKELLTRIQPYGMNDNGDDYWKHFETDRPVYQPKDTVKFWGYLESRDQAGFDELTVKLEYGWRTFIDETTVKVNPDGSFVGRMHLDNYDAGYYSLTYFVDGQIIGTRSIEIESYVKPAYNLSLTPDKKAYFLGESVNFDVETQFFDGTAAANVELKRYVDSAYENFSTNEDGQYRYSMDAELSYNCSINSTYYCSLYRSDYSSVSTVNADIADLYAESMIEIFRSELGIETTREENKINIETYTVDLSRINSEDYASSYPKLEDYKGASKGNQKLTGKVIEYKYEKIEDGEYYDYINKKVVKKYKYNKIENDLGTFTVTTDSNGKAQYEVPMKDGYFYSVMFEGKDSQDRGSFDYIWLYGDSGRSSDYDFHRVEFLNGTAENDEDSIFWGTPNTFFKIGEEVEAALYNNESPIEIEEDDRFLFMQNARGMRSYSASEKPEYQFRFGEEDLPNVNVDAVWFNGQNFITFNMASAKIDPSEKELDVIVETDKEEYAPGEEVEIKVKVKDGGKAVSNAAVNLNLVDEAYFRLFRSNFTDPLESIYDNVDPGILASYDTHEDVAVAEMDGGMGGCFTEETPILMADGTTKKIKDIKVGDVVLTRKHELSNELVQAEVVNLQEHYVQEYLVVNDLMEVTAEHTLFINGDWDVAGNLQIGDFLTDSSGERVYVESIETVKEAAWVYNFEVAGYHTYFANGIYVHNDKGGGPGEVRTQFRDNALFKLVETDAQGEATVSFTLPDNITSWRAAVSTIHADSKTAGHNISNVIVTKPFFTELDVNPEYSYKDSPKIKLQSFGDAVESGDTVTYQVESESLGIEKSEEFEGEVYKPSYFDLGELSKGKHNVTAYSSSGTNEDNLRKEFQVVGSRLNQTVVEQHYELEGEATTKDGRNNPYYFDLKEDTNSMIIFLDGGVGKYYGELRSLNWTSGDRLDQRLSKIISSELLNEYFDEDYEINDEDLATNYQSRGLRLLPYGDVDLRLTVNALLFENNLERYNQSSLAEYLYGIYIDENSNFEDVVLAVTGLAALDEPVLLSLRSLREGGDLNLREKMYVALAFDALGSKSEAREMLEEEFDNLVENSEDNEGVVITALGSVLAGSLGDVEKSDLLWEFVELIGMKDNQFSTNEDLLSLYRVGRVVKTLPNLRPESVRFSMFKNGDTESYELDGWKTASVIVNADDEFDVTVLKGTLDAVVVYDKAVTASEFPGDEAISVSRSYFVDGKETTSFEVGDIVEVVINVDYEGNVKYPSFMVQDVLPSGLKPVTSWQAVTENSQNAGKRYRYPYNVDGQEVSFYWSTKWLGFGEIRYLARVASLGEYYADPVKMQHYYNEELANISEPTIVTIEE